MTRIIFAIILSLAASLSYGQSLNEKSNLIKLDLADNYTNERSALISILRENGYRINKKLSDENMLVTRSRRLYNEQNIINFTVEISFEGPYLEFRGNILDTSLSENWLRVSSISPTASSRYTGWILLKELVNNIGSKLGGTQYFEIEPVLPGSIYENLYLG